MTENILVVDDNPQNLRLLVRILSEHNYKVRPAPSGVIALQSIASSLPDLILLDINMPQMNGYEVCEQLKQDPSTSAIPVIFLSALDDIQDKIKAFQVGGADYICKPFYAEEVLARIEHQLRIQRLQAELIQHNQTLKEAARLRDEIEHITRHDLKSPLNGIIALGSTLLEQHDFSKEEQEEMLKMMVDSGYRMLNMINRSLDLYKMEAGTYNFQLKDIELMKVLKHVYQDLNLFRKNIEIIIMVNNQLFNQQKVIVRGDDALCYSIFSNLVKNAIEASPKEEKVWIKVNELSNQVEIIIHNKGEVPQAIREKFFQKYITEGKTQGTGLGTYSAKLMIEIQKGKIVLDTTSLDETFIKVYLPTTLD